MSRCHATAVSCTPAQATSASVPLETLQKLAAVVFDEERREAEELIAGKDVVRESFFVPIPRAN